MPCVYCCEKAIALCGALNFAGVPASFFASRQMAYNGFALSIAASQDKPESRRGDIMVLDQ
jgi:hypothetical protein